MRKAGFWIVGILALALLVLVQGSPARADAFPELIPLPDGFQPEGVVVGKGPRIYAGSLATGAIYVANLRTGEGEILVPPQEGRTAVGLGYDPRTDYIFVSGGATGEAYVYSAMTGETVGVYTLTEPGTFVNDVIVTKSAAYFTDSFRPYLYVLPLGPGGQLPAPEDVYEIELSGDYEFVPGSFNTNGIEAVRNGQYLIIVNSTTGTLYRVEPGTGEAVAIDLGGESVPAGDGILLLGRTLYVVQNNLNQIAVIELSADYTSGTLTGLITDEDFDVPTTVDSFGRWLYAVNARFGTPGDDLEYDIVQVSKTPNN